MTELKATYNNGVVYRLADSSNRFASIGQIILATQEKKVIIVVKAFVSYQPEKPINGR
ncbi:MAG: hypothetical protein ACK5SY_00095 [bacterium]|jgi:hypothetical protein|uniref:Uncharacterized protein n=1 Tax=Bacteriophage sp. TaxID=38018 RepID=A0A7G9A434_9VIRU|nr:MAG: hypothetical protein [Bacteriophage sp.]